MGFRQPFIWLVWSGVTHSSHWTAANDTAISGRIKKALVQDIFSCMWWSCCHSCCTPRVKYGLQERNQKSTLFYAEQLDRICEETAAEKEKLDRIQQQKGRVREVESRSLCLSIWFGLWRQQPEIILKKKRSLEPVIDSKLRLFYIIACLRSCCDCCFCSLICWNIISQMHRYLLRISLLIHGMHR